MRVGVFSGDVIGRGRLDQVREEAAEAARDGLDSFWLPQIFGLDALGAITAIAASAPRIELGVSVVPTYSRHPLALAQQALTAQVAIGGRLALGVGPSHQMVVEGMYGLSYDRPARHVREYLSVLAPLVRTGSASFSGDVFRVNASLTVDGASSFPILLSALGPRMLAIAGQLADGTATWMCGLQTLRDHIVPTITREAERAGREQAPRIAAGVPVCVSDDPDAARAEAASMLGIYGQLPAYRAALDREGAAGPGDVAVVGDEGSVAEQLSAFAGAGVTDLIAVIYSKDATQRERTRAVLRELRRD